MEAISYANDVVPESFLLVSTREIRHAPLGLGWKLKQCGTIARGFPGRFPDGLKKLAVD
jgi:hypothetical protein